MPYWHILRQKPDVSWKERDDHLKLYLRLINNKGLFLIAIIGGLVLAGLYVAILAYLRFAFSFGIIALIPALISLFIFIVYKAIAPLEEFLFYREDASCNATQTGLCSTRTVKLHGVRRVEASVYEFSTNEGSRATSRGLRLTIHHENGRYVAASIWPSDDVRLKKAARAINQFLAASAAAVAVPPSAYPDFRVQEAYTIATAAQDTVIMGGGPPSYDDEEMGGIFIEDEEKDEEVNTTMTTATSNSSSSTTTSTTTNRDNQGQTKQFLPPQKGKAMDGAFRGNNKNNTGNNNFHINSSSSSSSNSKTRSGRSSQDRHEEGIMLPERNNDVETV